MNMGKDLKKTENVYTSLKNDIMEGYYRPSEKLVETELAKRYRTSRNTVKNVLLMLEQENMITHEPYKGAKVKAFNLEQLLDLLAVRDAVERLVVSGAAGHMGSDDIKKLEKSLEGMRKAIENNDFNSYSCCNNKFHAAIYAACRNRAAADIVEQIKAQFSKYNLKIAVIEGRRANSIQEHIAIYEALKNNDAVAAQDAISRHISSISKALRENKILLM